MLCVLKQSRLKETFLLTTYTTHDTRSIHNFLFGRPSFSFQSYDGKQINPLNTGNT